MFPKLGTSEFRLGSTNALSVANPRINSSTDVEEVVDDDGLRRGGRVREERAELRRDGADAGLVHFEHLFPLSR